VRLTVRKVIELIKVILRREGCLLRKRTSVDRPILISNGGVSESKFIQHKNEQNTMLPRRTGQSGSGRDLHARLTVRSGPEALSVKHLGSPISWQTMFFTGIYC
jgi:hypothetical protein